MWAKLTSRSTFAGFENHYPGPCHVSGSENLWISFWKLVRSFNGIYQNDQGTSSFKSSAITIFVVFWQKYLKSSSSLAETHWLTVWSLGHLGPIAQAQDLRLRLRLRLRIATDAWDSGSQVILKHKWDLRHETWDIGTLAIWESWLYWALVIGKFGSSRDQDRIWELGYVGLKNP